jgi:hypothetical protein
MSWMLSFHFFLVILNPLFPSLSSYHTELPEEYIIGRSAIAYLIRHGCKIEPKIEQIENLNV